MADFSSGGSIFGSIVQPLVEHTFNTMYQDSAQSFARYEAEKAFERERNFARQMQSQGTSLKMSDLRRAGLSPAFLNGAMLATNPLPAHSSAPSLQPQRSPSVNLAEGFLMEAQAKNLLADGGNKEADTEVKKLEADRKKIENYYLPQLKQREINLMDGDIQLKGSNIRYTDEQTKNLAQQTINLKEQLNEINAKVENLKAQTANLAPDTLKKYIDAYYASDVYQATIKKLSSEAHLNYTQADDLVKTRMARIFNLNAEGLHTYEEYNGLAIQNGRLAIDFELDQEYKETERKIDLFLRPVHAIGDVIGSFAPFVTRRVKTESNVTSHSTSNSMNENHNYNHSPRNGRGFGRKR